MLSSRRLDDVILGYVTPVNFQRDQHHPPRAPVIEKQDIYHCGLRNTRYARNARAQTRRVIGARESSPQTERSLGTVTRKSSQVYESAGSSLSSHCHHPYALVQRSKKKNKDTPRVLHPCRHVLERSRKDAKRADGVRKIGAQSLGDRNFIRRATNNTAAAFTFRWTAINKMSRTNMRAYARNANNTDEGIQSPRFAQNRLPSARFPSPTQRVVPGGRRQSPSI